MRTRRQSRGSSQSTQHCCGVAINLSRPASNRENCPLHPLSMKRNRRPLVALAISFKNTRFEKKEGKQFYGAVEQRKRCRAKLRRASQPEQLPLLTFFLFLSRSLFSRLVWFCSCNTLNKWLLSRPSFKLKVEQEQEQETQKEPFVAAAAADLNQTFRRELESLNGPTVGIVHL